MWLCISETFIRCVYGRPYLWPSWGGLVYCARIFVLLFLWVSGCSYVCGFFSLVVSYCLSFDYFLVCWGVFILSFLLILCYVTLCIEYCQTLYLYVLILYHSFWVRFSDAFMVVYVHAYYVSSLSPCYTWCVFFLCLEYLLFRNSQMKNGFWRSRDC